MKKILIVLVLITAISSSFAQTIIWKELASLPEGYYLGEAVALNKEIYFVTGRSDKALPPFFYKFNPDKNEWIKLADIPNPTMNLLLLLKENENLVKNYKSFDFTAHAEY